MKYNKLVRDKIPDIIMSKGEKAITHIANNEEFSKKLNDKLLEEVNEYLKNPSTEELADILEVIRAICDNKNITIDDVKNPAISVFEHAREKTFSRHIEAVRKKKLLERGGFSKRLILDETVKIN